MYNPLQAFLYEMGRTMLRTLMFRARVGRSFHLRYDPVSRMQFVESLCPAAVGKRWLVPVESTVPATNRPIVSLSLEPTKQCTHESSSNKSFWGIIVAHGQFFVFVSGLKWWSPSFWDDGDSHGIPLMVLAPRVGGLIGWISEITENIMKWNDLRDISVINFRKFHDILIIYFTI